MYAPRGECAHEVWGMCVPGVEFALSGGECARWVGKWARGVGNARAGWEMVARGMGNERAGWEMWARGGECGRVVGNVRAG